MGSKRKQIVRERLPESPGYVWLQAWRFVLILLALIVIWKASFAMTVMVTLIILVMMGIGKVLVEGKVYADVRLERYQARQQARAAAERRAREKEEAFRNAQHQASQKYFDLHGAGFHGMSHDLRDDGRGLLPKDQAGPGSNNPVPG